MSDRAQASLSVSFARPVTTAMWQSASRIVLRDGVFHSDIATTVSANECLDHVPATRSANHLE